MTLQQQILQYIEKHPEAWRCKVESASERGVPDILVCARGCFIGIEVKQTRRDKASPIQKEQIIRIIEAGGHGWFIRDFETFRNLFEGIYNGSTKDKTYKNIDQRYFPGYVAKRRPND